MACIGAPVGYSAVYHTITGTLEVGKHRLDEAVLAAALGIAEELWQHLVDRTVPPPTFPADTAVWNRLHPTSTAGTVELPADLVDDLTRARLDERQAAARADLLEAAVKERLGDIDTGTVDGTPVIRWKTVLSRRVDLKALEADAPDLVEAHRQAQTARRFTSSHHQPNNRTIKQKRETR